MLMASNDQKSIIYQLIYKSIILVLALIVFTTTIEQAFSVMNIDNTKCRNRI